MSKWKTVDSPPDNQSNVLVISDTMYAMGWYQPSNKTWHIFTFHGAIDTKKVTHWRELPKLPKE